MQKNSILIGLIALIIGAGGGYAIAMGTIPEVLRTSGHMMSDDSMMGGSAMQNEMDGMVQGLSGKTGDAFDKAFLSEMTMHHQGAVQMAELALKNARHQEIKDMAQAIITAQNGEIQQMQDWGRQWYEN